MYLENVNTNLPCDTEIPYLGTYPQRNTYASDKKHDLKKVIRAMLAVIANKKRTNNLKKIQMSIESRMDKYTVTNSHTGIL